MKNEILVAMASDMKITKYELESDAQYTQRVLYSALACWVKAATLDRDISQPNSVGASKKHIKEKCTKIIGAGCKMGEGWLLTAEMMELIESGYGNIVCAQPFGCLPNHIVGKGMIRKLKELYPQSNIVPIDYDPGASEVNQINRIKLMIYAAFENLKKKQD